MQAIIMAAGKGSRLGELTKDKPKSFLEIKEKKLIEYNIQMLHKYGIKDIIIVVGYRDQDFVEFTKNIPGIKLVYNPFYEMVNVLGSFWMAQNELKDDFIYLHADTICDLSIFEALLSEAGDIVLPIDGRPCDEEAMKVKVETGKVIKITKDMPCDESAGEFIGIAKIKKRVLPDLRAAATQLMREKAFASYFEAAIQRVIDEKKYDIISLGTRGAFWAEVDVKKDYEWAAQMIPESLIKIF